MLSIAIDRFKTRYRIPVAALREQPRVQRIVDDALARVLEAAIEREGIGQNGHVCVRDVDAVTTLRLREPDSALATRVGDAIATAIRKKLEEGSTSVVQYGSRAHALIDLASSATAGDFSRSWAWAQLGIWRSDFPLRADVSAELVLRALVKEPSHAAAVIAYLARERTDRLRDLIARATPDAWGALADAAVVAAGGRGSRIARTAATAGLARAASESGPLAPISPVARRVLMHSSVARATMARATGSAEIRAALAALALLEVEPSAVRGSDAAQLLATIARALDRGASDAVPPADTLDHENATADVQSAGQAALDNAGPRDDGAAAAAGEKGAKRAIDARDPAHSARERDARLALNAEDAGSSLGEDARTASGERSRHETGGVRDDRRESRGEREDAPSPETRDRAIDERPSPAGDQTPDAVPDVRGLTRTAHGGLLYLVNLLPRIGLVDVLGDDPRWSDRGLRWVLHQLAMALADIGPDDPAALVFAGLMPGAPSPSSLQDPPTELELAVLATLRADIARALRVAIGRPAESDSPAAESHAGESDSGAPAPGSDAGESDSDRVLLDHVCRHPAQIVAEPGWIEARFALEDVSLDIRRAGLDRDPDWVPWLGLVLRFIYG